MKKWDISGTWEFCMNGERDEIPKTFYDVMELPDSVSHAGKGTYNSMPETGFLCDPYAFSGTVWFRKEMVLEESVLGKTNFLFLERSRITTVYLDGVKIGERDSLVAPHQYQLPDDLDKGTHTLLISVNNTEYKTGGGHMTSPDTQTNWIGILGKMEIRSFEKLHFTDAKIRTIWVRDTEWDGNGGMPASGQEARISVKGKLSESFAKTEVTLRIKRVDTKEEIYRKKFFCTAELNEELQLSGQHLLWDEYEPNRFLLTLETENGEEINREFGIRKMSSKVRRLKINGRDLFLRGKHDGMVFPMTGYAPMDKTSWMDVFRTAKEYGINHYRFHTCCPPEAAFEAADEIGIYLEPEIPFWGTVAAEGEDGYCKEEQTYLIEEGFRILREFGNHPSFVMFSMGNELWGNDKVIGNMIADFRKEDDDKMYLGGSNSFQFVPRILPEEDIYCGVRFSKERLFRGSYAMCDAPLGHIQTKEPNSCYRYDSLICPEKKHGSYEETGDIQIQYKTGVKTVKGEAGRDELIPEIPVISHEVGQYSFYPDFSEEETYTGVLKANYLSVYRKRLEEKDLYKNRNRYFVATGNLAVACYKAEIEAALQTENLSGFQLLDLQDFPGQNIALVGILNAFLHNKGFIDAKSWNAFCGDFVPMAQIKHFVVSPGETMEIPFVVSDCRKQQEPGERISYVFRTQTGEIVKAGSWNYGKGKTRIVKVGTVTITIPNVDKITAMELQICAENHGEEILSTNRYEFMIYPQCDIEIKKDCLSVGEKQIKICKTVSEALLLKEKNIHAICIPEAGEDSVPGTYCTDFWNYPMFSSISKSMNKPLPVGTLGLSIDNRHRFFEQFPSKTYSTPQWFHAVMHSHCDILDEKDASEIQVLVEPIDNVERCHRLGMLYIEKGILVCTVRLWEIAEKPEVKAFANAMISMF